MTATSKYPMTIDGISLHTRAWSVETKDGRDVAPGSKDANIDVENDNGVLWVPNKKFDTGKVILKMWVAGQDADGNVSADSYKKYRDNLDMLRILFSPRHRLLDVRQQLDVAGTSIRQALAEVSAVIEPRRVAEYPYTSKFTVELTIPGSFWQDVADKDYDSNGVLAVTNNSVHTCTNFLGTTAPMQDLYVVVDGPAAVGTKIIDETTGHFSQLTRVLGATEDWVINTTEWTSKVGVGIEFTQGGTDSYTQTVYGGAHSPRLFGLAPRYAGAPQVRVQGSGFTGATRLRVRGRRKFL